ncbi:MAG TPA: hypothetical protein VD884_17500 [Ohtaekwangia sp.]|nr:hypothetical protein [Ohtaekwangia sp.]
MENNSDDFGFELVEIPDYPVFKLDIGGRISAVLSTRDLDNLLKDMNASCAFLVPVKERPDLDNSVNGCLKLLSEECKHDKATYTVANYISDKHSAAYLRALTVFDPSISTLGNLVSVKYDPKINIVMRFRLM